MPLPGAGTPPPQAQRPEQGSSTKPARVVAGCHCQVAGRAARSDCRYRRDRRWPQHEHSLFSPSFFSGHRKSIGPLTNRAQATCEKKEQLYAHRGYRIHPLSQAGRDNFASSQTTTTTRPHPMISYDVSSGILGSTPGSTGGAPAAAMHVRPPPSPERWGRTHQREGWASMHAKQMPGRGEGGERDSGRHAYACVGGCTSQARRACSPPTRGAAARGNGLRRAATGIAAPRARGLTCSLSSSSMSCPSSVLSFSSRLIISTRQLPCQGRMGAAGTGAVRQSRWRTAECEPRKAVGSARLMRRATPSRTTAANRARGGAGDVRPSPGLRPARRSGAAGAPPPPCASRTAGCW